MSIGQGAAARVGLGKESTWGTGIAIDQIIPFNSEGINKAVKMIESSYLDGSAGKRNLVSSLIEAIGDLSGEMIWDEISGGIIGIESLLRGFTGASSRDAVNNLNKYDLNPTIDDSYTLAFNKQVSAWEIQGAKFKTLNIAGAKGEVIKFAVGVIGKNIYLTGDSGIINTISGIQAISPAVNPTMITFDNLAFRIGDQANALTSADQFAISGFEFSGDNKLSDPDHSTPTTTHLDAKETLEPVRNGIREMSLKLSIPRYTSDQFSTWLTAHTPLQADLIWTNGSKLFKILIPNLYISNVGAPISGAEIIKQEVELMLIRNAGTNPYMTHTDASVITNEFAIESKSSRTAAA